MHYIPLGVVQVSEEYQALKAEAGELGVDWLDLREERQRKRRLARIAACAHMMATQGQQVGGGSGGELV